MLPLGIRYNDTRHHIEPTLAYTVLGTLLVAISAVTAYYLEAAAG